MTVSRVIRMSNPRRRRASAKRRNPKRRLSLKQKLHFGSARQRAAAKASLRGKRANPKRRRATATKHRRRTVRATNPRRRRSVARKVTRRRRAKSNPAYMITLPGLVNPRPSRRRKTTTKRRKKVNTMARTKSNTRRRRRASANPRRRRRNSVRVIVRRRNRRRPVAANPRRRRRRSNPTRRMNARRRHHSVRRRNPSLFGSQVNAFGMAKAIAGGLAGVAITKAVPNMLPPGIGGTPIMNTVISIAVAVAAGMAVKALVKGDPTLGDAVLFGGLMQAGSVALNAFLPSVGGVIGLQGLGNGMGDLVPGRFPVPQNPISAGQMMLAPPPMAAPAAAGMHGLAAIFNPYGRAM